jgi:uncharacterized membrane protein YfhO
MAEKEFTTASISRIDDTRNHVSVDVDVPAGDSSALLIFSRPYFGGYEARIGDERLRVDSYRGLFPIVEILPGSHGKFVLIYRPWWLIAGSAIAILSVAVFVTELFATWRSRRQSAAATDA